jgi:hypothetical protein
MMVLGIFETLQFSLSSAGLILFLFSTLSLD